MRKIRFSSENMFAALLLIAGLLLPVFMKSYQLSVYSYYIAMTILVLSITLVWGYAGIFSFGQAAFMGMGAYIYGIVGKAIDNKAFTPLAMILAVLVMMIVGAILAYLIFYGGVNDVFVGLITMCIGIALETFMGQTAGNQWKVFGVKLGGYNGMTKIPMLHLGNYKLTDVAFYFVSFAILVVLYLSLRWLLKTKAGYSLIAIRENRQRSELFGYNVPFIQVVVFSVSTGMAALAGVLYSAWGAYIAPSNLSMTQSTIPIVIVASGGRKNPTAAILFSLCYYIFSSQLSKSGSELNYVILGFVLIIVLLFIPEGLFSALFHRLDELVLRKKLR